VDDALFYQFGNSEAVLRIPAFAAGSVAVLDNAFSREDIIGDFIAEVFPIGEDALVSVGVRTAEAAEVVLGFVLVFGFRQYFAFI
jgi:hypothetical protein